MFNSLGGAKVVLSYAVKHAWWERGGGKRRKQGRRTVRLAVMKEAAARRKWKSVAMNLRRVGALGRF